MAAKKKATAVAKRGRPSKYSKELIGPVKQLVARGLTDGEIANVLQICEATLYNWKNEYPELLEAMKREKDIVNQQVEATLIRTALGYTERVTEINHGKKITYDKKFDPNVSAMRLYLQNRMPEVYREKRENTHIHSADAEFAEAMMRMNARVEGKKRKEVLRIERENAEDVEPIE